ncbi:hypothetical protein LJC53_06475 [Bacteroidales bacterium OttesenSCG-928-C03]|nr:hypothetical protein [Bacteroidales bacterium OttesenSCG-928-C03]
MRKITKIHKIVAMLLACGLLYACDYPAGEIRIDQESKDYCLFAEGSYWIYQDSATLKIDSVVIDKPIYYNLRRSNGNGYDCETYSSRVSVYSHDTVLSFSTRLTTSQAYADDLKPCLLMYRGIKYHNGGIGEMFPGFINLIILLAQKNIYSINGITYSDVKIFEENYLAQKNIYYWAKHIGLIREEIYENDSLISVKNLIKYNVKPYNQ